jgi:hypothetical protein
MLIAIGGISAADPTWSEQFRAKYARTPQGSALPILIRRDGREMTLNARLAFTPRVESHLVEDPRASAKAHRVRDGILKGITAP